MMIKEITQEDTWEIRHMVMWPDKPLDYIKLPDDHIGIHYGLFINDELTSVVSCFVANDEMQFRKLATLTNKQGQGYGTKLMQHIIDVAGKKGVKRLWCNARVNKKAFYEQFGLTDTGKRFNKGGIEFTIMELRLNDEQQLKFTLSH